MAKLFTLLLMAGLAMAQAPLRIVLVGDSTVNDEGGWGEGFRAGLRATLRPPPEVINLAKNGRSSKSFRDEGLWEPALALKPDYIVIQFGHNDEPGKGPERETDPATTYRANILRYVEEARAAGAEPVLVTSIVRRNFDADGKIKRDHMIPYVEEVRKIAQEKEVMLMDMYSVTLKQAEALPAPERESLNAVTKDGKTDTTHLGAKGRMEVGKLAAAEFLSVITDP